VNISQPKLRSEKFDDDDYEEEGEEEEKKN